MTMLLALATATIQHPADGRLINGLLASPTEALHQHINAQPHYWNLVLKSGRFTSAGQTQIFLSCFTTINIMSLHCKAST